MFFNIFKSFTLLFLITNYINAQSFNTGDKIKLKIDNFNYKLIYLSQINSFPVGINDSELESVDYSFFIGETEISYKLWEIVYSWAIKNGYKFINKGQMGSNGKDNSKMNKKHPVTKISYIDAVIWSNALTQYYNSNLGPNDEKLEFVYFVHDEPFRNFLMIEDEYKYLNFSKIKAYNLNSGFRLPNKKEWELAARISLNKKNNTVPKFQSPFFISGNSPSGSNYSYENEKQNEKFAFYNNNYTKKVGNTGFLFFANKKYKNDIGIYDMSGNVWELISDNTSVLIKGGAWNTDSDDIQVAYELEIDPFCYMLYLRNNEFDIGFRIARTF